MWNPDLYQEALKFAAQAHGAQKVPGSDISYVVHLSNVAQEIMLASRQAGFDVDLALQCALLHDTLEDTQVDFATLAARFGERVARGVAALTKDAAVPKAERMMESLGRIRQQPAEIWMVKLADRITNMQVPPHFWSAKKRSSYRDEAKLIREHLGTAHLGLDQRLAFKIDNYAQFIRA